MYLKKLLQLGRRKAGDDIEIGDLGRGISEEVEKMATKNQKDSPQSLAQSAMQPNSTTKILTVQDGDHSTVLVDYAVKMAQKLDCEIIALDVSEQPLEHTGERREREEREAFITSFLCCGVHPNRVVTFPSIARLVDMTSKSMGTARNRFV